MKGPDFQEPKSTTLHCRQARYLRRARKNGLFSLKVENIKFLSVEKSSLGYPQARIKIAFEERERVYTHSASNVKSLLDKVARVVTNRQTLGHPLRPDDHLVRLKNVLQEAQAAFLSRK